MAFDLSFSPEFFFNEGEPYDDGPGPSDRPTSVWQALQSMPESDWRAMCEDCGLHPEYSGLEEAMALIEETNTCGNLNSPVEVWIDQDGYHTIRVWDRNG